VALDGAVIHLDRDSTQKFYGHPVTLTAALQGDTAAPPEAYPFLSSLAKWAQAAAK
jgi:lipid-binding SYLF domain-containing protein